MKNGFAKKTKIGDVIALEMVSDDNSSKHLKNHYVFMKILFDVDKQYRDNPNATNI